jgi:hypothetical protein
VLIRRREVAADLFAIEAAHVSCDGPLALLIGFGMSPTL